MTDMNEYGATTETERSAEEIQENVVAKEQEITESVKEIGERIQQKLDWRNYVSQSPYAALGIAAGLGVLASRMVIPSRPTTVQRILGTVGEEVGYGISGLLRGAGKTAVSLSFWSVASALAASFAKKAIWNALAGEGAEVGSSSRRPTTTDHSTRGQMAANV